MGPFLIDDHRCPAECWVYDGIVVRFSSCAIISSIHRDGQAGVIPFLSICEMEELYLPIPVSTVGSWVAVMAGHPVCLHLAFTAALLRQWVSFLFCFYTRLPLLQTPTKRPSNPISKMDSRTPENAKTCMTSGPGRSLRYNARDLHVIALFYGDSFHCGTFLRLDGKRMG